MLREFVLVFFISAQLSLFADISSKYLLLPEDTWELSPLYIDKSSKNEDAIYGMPFRYGINEKLEFLSLLGLKYLAYDGRKNKLAIFASIPCVGYGSLNGFSYCGSTGLIYRNLDLSDTRVSLGTVFNYEKSDTGYEDEYVFPVSAVYSLSSSFEVGMTVSFIESYEYHDYSGSFDYKTNKSRFTKGLFFYYYFTEDFNIKSGVYAIAEESDYSDNSKATNHQLKEYDAFLYQLVWRF